MIDNPREERELEVESDILYFLKCLGKNRNTHFSDLGKPDEENRNKPRPDRRAIDDSTGRKLIIEHMQLRIQDDMPRERYESERGITFRSFLRDEELAKKLSSAIEQKREKSQYIDYPDDEKILLFRDWVSITHRIDNFVQCIKYFKPPKNPGYDHCYILLRSHGDIFQLF